MADLVKVIDPDSGPGTNYVSGSAWEAAYGGVAGSGDCVTYAQRAVGKCRSTGGTADTTGFTISGWTATSAAYYPLFWTDPTDSGGDGANGSYRHSNLYPTAGQKIYHLESAAYCVRVSQAYAKVIGIALKPTYSTDDRSAIKLGASSTEASYNLIKGSSAGSITYPIGILVVTGTGTILVYQNTIYEITGTGTLPTGIWVASATGQNVYVAYNTVVGCTNGIRNVGTAGNSYAIGNVVFNATDCFYGTWTSGSEDNAYSEGSDPGTGGVLLGGVAADYFVDPANDDYHILGSTVICDVGVNMYAHATCPITRDNDYGRRPAIAAFDLGSDDLYTTTSSTSSTSSSTTSTSTTSTSSTTQSTSSTTSTTQTVPPGGTSSSSTTTTVTSSSSSSTSSSTTTTSTTTTITLPPKSQGYYPYGSGKDMLLERIWVEPRTIAPDFIVEDVDYTVKVWNAYQDNAYNWTTQSVVAGDGTAFTHAALPIAFATGEDDTYTMTLEGAGPVVQSTSYQLKFGDSALWQEISIAGTRALLVVLEPDWRDGLEFSQEYETAIYSSELYVEQRRPHREFTSCRLAIRFMAQNAQAQKMLTKLLYGKDKVFAVPIYPEILHPVAVTQTATSVTLVTDPTHHWYLVNRMQYVLIVDWAAEQVELKQKLSISYITPSITFTTAISGLFGTNALLYPLMLCEIESFRPNHTTDRIDSVDIVFRELVGVH